MIDALFLKRAGWRLLSSGVPSDLHPSSAPHEWNALLTEKPAVNHSATD